MINREIHGLRYRAVFLLILILFSATIWVRSFGLDGVRFRLTDIYVFENRGSDLIQLSEMDRAVSLFQNNSGQTVRVVEVDPPIERLLNDSDGNPYAVLEVPESINGTSYFTITVVYEIDSVSYSGPVLRMEDAQDRSYISSGLVSEYCASGGTWLTENPEIREMAEGVAGNRTKVLDIVEALISWVESNITYESAEVPRYPNETLKEGKGDCDDQSILLITMCRVLGIPAYLQIGCILDERLGQVNQSSWGDHVRVNINDVGWHGWSMVYIPPWGWLPVDLTYVTGSSGLVPEIEHAGIYQDYVILQQNISRYDYAGESRRARDWIINSTLYITLNETMVQLPGPAPSVPWIVVIPLVVGSIVVFFLYTRRRAHI